MNSGNPQAKSSVAADGNIEDSNIIIGNNNNVAIHSKKATQKHSPLCNYPDCEFESEYKCNSCGKVFCLKHIAYFEQPWLRQWLCAECIRKKMDTQKQITNAGLGIGSIGLFLLLISSISHDSSLLCLVYILTTIGFGVSGGMGLRYYFTQRSFKELFPEEEIMSNKKYHS